MALEITSGTTVANTVSHIVFAPYYQRIEIVNRGTTELWFRVDGVDPTVSGDECDVVPGDSYKDNILNLNAAGTDIRLISTGVVDYTVSGIYN